MPARPRINTASSHGSAASLRQKRTSLSPHTLTPHSSYRRSQPGLRGRKSTSSSVSSIRSAFQPHHQHTHSKASSTSSTSLASPSTASGSRMARSPHASVKVLPSTPTGLPSGVRVSRRPPPGVLTGFTEARGAFGGLAPASPSLPVFARRKRSVFKGPSPRARSGSAQGRRSGEMIPGITEEEEDEDGMEEEEVDQFGPELVVPGRSGDVLAQELTSEPVTPLSPPELGSPMEEEPGEGKVGDGDTIPLTAEALKMMEEGVKS